MTVCRPAAAPSVLKIHALIPSPVPMTEDLLWQLRDLYDGLVPSQPDAAPRTRDQRAAPVQPEGWRARQVHHSAACP